MSYGSLRALSSEVEANLRRFGIGAVDRVAIVLPNGPEMATAFVTIAQAAVTVPLDRSPCVTGFSARMAQVHAKGRLKVGDRFNHESFIGTLFDCHIQSETEVGRNRAIRPSVAGWARVIGHNTIFVDDRDPRMKGFQIA